MRIFRTLILLTGLAIFLPSPPEDAGASKVQAATDDSGLLGSATLAIVDAAGFCSRQPMVCKTAGFVAVRLEAKAKYNVKLLYEWASAPSSKAAPQPAASQTVASDPLKTGTASDAPVRLAGGQSTLKIEDLIPEWRGPLPKTKG